MFLFTIKSRVNRRSKASERFHGSGGAYVSCYIAFKDFQAAEKLAKLLIREQGWIPEKEFEAWKLQKQQMRTKKDKQYYSEASKYGFASSSITGRRMHLIPILTTNPNKMHPNVARETSG